MKISDVRFHRLFSKSMYKTLKLPLWEMTFSKDFVNDRRGDLYPVLKKSEDAAEAVIFNRYTLKCGNICRLAGSFFPYASYEVTFTPEDGSGGFLFHIPTGEASVLCGKEDVTFSDGDMTETVPHRKSGEITLTVSCRPAAFDVYLAENGKPEYLCTFKSERFSSSAAQKLFENGYTAFLANGSVTVSEASSFLDCGISQADIRPIRYKTGEVMTEHGKVYLTVSIRLQEGTFQGVFSWVPGTSDFELTGALFFDKGDGVWGSYVASCILYDKERDEWLLWTSSFAHKHILCHAAFKGDPRFGVNVVDVTIMEEAQTDDITVFTGFVGDEDPDFFYDEKERKWYLAVCRQDPSIGAYRYLFFRSDEPFAGYEYIGSSFDGEETGGSFVNFEGERLFVCGNDFKKRANYRIYRKGGMEEASFDFDDGGFRGWGTVIPVTLGSRRRYFWLTFDRHNGSSYNWSYGNWYGFEAVKK